MSTTPSVSLFIWDEMVHRGLVADKLKIAPIIHNNFQGVYPFIQRELGRDAITDVFSGRYFNEIIPNRSFAEVALAHCFPNDIHIVDVEFSDNRKRLARKTGFREYRGLHVFDQFLDRLKGVAVEKGADRISLLVAEPPLHKVFKRHGFVMSETEMAQIAYKNARRGYPMVLSVT